MIFTIRQALKGASKATKTTKEQDDLEALFTVDTKGSETRWFFALKKSGDLLGMG